MKKNKIITVALQWKREKKVEKRSHL